ncbi:hypothetical protein TWF281_010021 [Arthrobotrys megalospora]
MYFFFFQFLLFFVRSFLEVSAVPLAEQPPTTITNHHPIAFNTTATTAIDSGTILPQNTLVTTSDSTTTPHTTSTFATPPPKPISSKSNAYVQETHAGAVEQSEPSLGGDTSPSKDRKPTEVPKTSRALAPSMFISMYISCPNGPDLLAMDENPDNYVEFPTTGDRPFRRPEFRGLNQNAAMAKAREWKNKCENCNCDSKTGRLVKNNVPRPQKNGKQATGKHAGRYKCNGNTGDKCMAWFGCKCNYLLKQPPKDEAIPLADYQKALDYVPQGLKDRFPDYRWKPHGDQGASLGFSPGYTSRGASLSNEDIEFLPQRELVPGTKEPYYLEGPGHRSPWDALGKPYLNDGIGGGPWTIPGAGGISQYVKREEDKD